MKNYTLRLLLIICFAFSSFTGFTADSFFGISNIVLKSFSGSTDGQSAKLSWDFGEIENEVACMLERSSDGIVFSPIETFTVKKGFSGVMSASDKLVIVGVYYYRLHLAKTGFIPYISNVISIKIIKGEEPVKEYKVENPFRQQLTIKGNFGSNPLVVEIADLNGRVRISKTFNAAANRDYISVPSGILDNGVYIVRIKEEKYGGQQVLLTKQVVKSAK